MQLTNETLINGEVGSYFRQIDGRWELNRQIDPHYSREEWATIPGEAVRICQAVTSNSISLGQLLRYTCEAYTKLVAAEAQADMFAKHGSKMAEIIATRFWASPSSAPSLSPLQTRMQQSHSLTRRTIWMTTRSSSRFDPTSLRTSRTARSLTSTSPRPAS